MLFSGNEIVISMETNSRTMTEVYSTRFEPELNPQPPCPEALVLTSARWPFPEIRCEKMMKDTSQITLMKFMSESLSPLGYSRTFNYYFLTWARFKMPKCCGAELRRDCSSAGGLIVRHSLLRGEQVEITKIVRWFAKSGMNRKAEHR